uniref:Zn(2)-C6 fungal-type domain-containing protein n=1 Tax=Ganoderma boninense TaxID=34458 RepID=A0A5K1JW09_9APHY|nr:Zn(2)-C6 fungal-type domain-containing protein [Ganoderma boninense]
MSVCAISSFLRKRTIRSPALLVGGNSSRRPLPIPPCFPPSSQNALCRRHLPSSRPSISTQIRHQCPSTSIQLIHVTLFDVAVFDSTMDSKELARRELGGI